MVSPEGKSSLVGRWGGLGAVALLVVFLSALPGAADYYTLSVLRDALLFGLFALALDYFWGKTGELSFGHATFFGLGAYAMAIVNIKGGLDPGFGPWLGLIAGILAAGLIALIVGYFLIFGGVRGPYFTVVTLALTVIAKHIAIGWSDVTGGDAGLIGVPPLSLSALGIDLVFMGNALYYLALALVTLSLLGLWLACRGHYGKVLAAIQDHEARARALGHHTSLHILVVFTVSAMLSGLAGAVYVTGTGFVAPDMIALMLSTEVVMWVAVGGRGTLIGPVIGAFVVIRLEQEVSSIDTKLWPLVIGGFFVTMVFLFPDGIMTVLRHLKAAWRRLSPAGGRR